MFLTLTKKYHSRMPPALALIPQDRGPLPAWTYSRLSDASKSRKRGKAKVGSIAQQDQENLRACTGHGWGVDRQWSDDDISASRFATRRRPDWDELIEALEGSPVLREDSPLRPARVLVMYETSRGDRTMASWTHFLDLCRATGTLLYDSGTDRLYDPDNTADRQALLMEGMHNEKASDETSRRVRRDMRANAYSGRPHGPGVYGYERVYGSDRELLEVRIVEEEAGVLREAALRISRHEAPLGICADFDRRGILSPAAAVAARKLAVTTDPEKRARLEEIAASTGWLPATLQSMIKRPTYTGERVHRGQVVAEAIWPPILSSTLAAQARSVLAGRSRPRRDGRVRYLASFIMQCGVCAQPVHGSETGRESGLFNYYCKKGHASRRMPIVDEYITDSVIARLASPDILRLLASDHDRRREAERVFAEADELELRLKEATDSHARTGRPSLRVLAQLEQTLEADIDGLRSKGRRLAISPVLRNMPLGEPEPAVRAAWEAFTVVQKRAVIRILTQKIELFPGRTKHNPVRNSVKIHWAVEEPPGDDGSAVQVQD
jgi:site-specific DNA recombinase